MCSACRGVITSPPALMNSATPGFLSWHRPAQGDMLPPEPRSAAQLHRQDPPGRLPGGRARLPPRDPVHLPWAYRSRQYLLLLLAVPKLLALKGERLKRHPTQRQVSPQAYRKPPGKLDIEDLVALAMGPAAMRSSAGWPGSSRARQPGAHPWRASGRPCMDCGIRRPCACCGPASSPR